MKNIKNMTKAELEEYAAVNNIPLDDMILKVDIRKRIETVFKERAAALDEQPPVDAPTPPAGTPDALEDIDIDTDTGQNPAAAPVPSSTSTEASGIPTDNEDVKINRVLRVTKPLLRGDDVKAIQNALIARNLHCGAEGANGIYNASTAFAVRMFQSHSRFIVSGKVDKLTAQALGFTWQEAEKPPAPPTLPPVQG